MFRHRSSVFLRAGGGPAGVSEACAVRIDPLTALSLVHGDQGTSAGGDGFHLSLAGKEFSVLMWITCGQCVNLG